MKIETEIFPLHFQLFELSSHLYLWPHIHSKPLQLHMPLPPPFFCFVLDFSFVWLVHMLGTTRNPTAASVLPYTAISAGVCFVWEQPALHACIITTQTSEDQWEDKSMPHQMKPEGELTVTCWVGSGMADWSPAPWNHASFPSCFTITRQQALRGVQPEVSGVLVHSFYFKNRLLAYT